MVVATVSALLTVGSGRCVVAKAHGQKNAERGTPLPTCLQALGAFLEDVRRGPGYPLLAP